MAILGSFNLPMGSNPGELQSIINQIAKSGVYNPDTQQISFYKEASDGTTILYSIDVNKLKTDISTSNATEVTEADFSGADLQITKNDDTGDYTIIIQNAPRLGGKAASLYALKAEVVSTTALTETLADYATIDDNNLVNQTAKTAQNYDTTTGSIKTTFDSINTSISDISAKLEGLSGAVVYIGKIDEDLTGLENDQIQSKLNAAASTILDDRELETGYTILDTAGTEWWYNGTTGFEQWMSLGQNIIGNASNNEYGVIKGDGTYLTISNGIVQVLKADTATTAATANNATQLDNHAITDFVLQTEIGTTAGKIPKIEESGKLPASIIDVSSVTCTVYQVDATLTDTDADKLETIDSFKAGDIAIITKKNEGTTYSITSYIATNSSTWVPMCGKITADNCVFTKDIIAAGNYTQVGNITKGATATKNLGIVGKSVHDVLTEIFSQEQQPAITAQPSVSGFNLSGAGAVEAGTSVNPATLSAATLSAGSYTAYSGQVATGVTATSYVVKRITNSATTEVTNGSGAFTGYSDNNSNNGFIIGDQGEENVVSSLKYRVEITHGAGATALTNLGNPSDPPVAIAAGTKTKDTNTYTPYRCYFYKVSSDSSDVGATLNSAYIRGFANKANANSLNSLNLNIPEGTKRVVIAVPSTKTLTKVIDVAGMGLDIVGSFASSVVQVEGANGYTAINYNVYVFENANGVSASTFQCTF